MGLVKHVRLRDRLAHRSITRHHHDLAHDIGGLALPIVPVDLHGINTRRHHRTAIVGGVPNQGYRRAGGLDIDGGHIGPARLGRGPGKVGPDGVGAQGQAQEVRGGVADHMIKTAHPFPGGVIDIGRHVGQAAVDHRVLGHAGHHARGTGVIDLDPVITVGDRHPLVIIPVPDADHGSAIVDIDAVSRPIQRGDPVARPQGDPVDGDREVMDRNGPHDLPRLVIDIDADVVIPRHGRRGAGVQREPAARHLGVIDQHRVGQHRGGDLRLIDQLIGPYRQGRGHDPAQAIVRGRISPRHQVRRCESDESQVGWHQIAYYEPHGRTTRHRHANGIADDIPAMDQLIADDLTHAHHAARGRAGCRGSGRSIGIDHGIRAGLRRAGRMRIGRGAGIGDGPGTGMRIGDGGGIGHGGCIRIGGGITQGRGVGGGRGGGKGIGAGMGVQARRGIGFRVRIGGRVRDGRRIGLGVRIRRRVRIGGGVHQCFRVGVGCRVGIRHRRGEARGIGIRAGIGDRIRVGDRIGIGGCVRIDDGGGIGRRIGVGVRVGDRDRVGIGMGVGDRVRIGRRIRGCIRVCFGDRIRVGRTVRDRIGIRGCMRIRGSIGRGIGVRGRRHRGIARDRVHQGVQPKGHLVIIGALVQSVRHPVFQGSRSGGDHRVGQGVSAHVRPGRSPANRVGGVPQHRPPRLGQDDRRRIGSRHIEGVIPLQNGHPVGHDLVAAKAGELVRHRIGGAAVAAKVHVHRFRGVPQPQVRRRAVPRLPGEKTIRDLHRRGRCRRQGLVDHDDRTGQKTPGVGIGVVGDDISAVTQSADRRGDIEPFAAKIVIVADGQTGRVIGGVVPINVEIGVTDVVAGITHAIDVVTVVALPGRRFFQLHRFQVSGHNGRPRRDTRDHHRGISPSAVGRQPGRRARHITITRAHILDILADLHLIEVGGRNVGTIRGKSGLNTVCGQGLDTHEETED